MPFTRREALMSTGALAAASAFPLATTVTMAQDASPSSPPIPPSGTEPICLADFEPLAKAKMPTLGWDYSNGGAGDELTMQWNKEAYQRIRLKPHLLVNLSRLDTRVTRFGQEHAFPILLAPAAQKLTHPEGELATGWARRAKPASRKFSTFCSVSLPWRWRSQAERILPASTAL